MAKAYVNKRDKFLWDNSFKPEDKIPVPAVSDVGKAVVVDADGDYTLGDVSIEDEIVYFKIDAQGENLIDCTMAQIKAALDNSKTVCLIRINGTTKFILPLFVYVPLTGSVNYAEFTNCKPGTYISRRRVNYETVKLDFANDTITYTDESYYTDLNYSTGERVVGTWVDGKPIYEKTVIVDNIPSSDWTAHSIGVNDADIIDVSGYIESDNHVKWTINYYYNTNTMFNIYISSGSFVCYWKYSESTYSKAVLTFRYTKTTD